MDSALEAALRQALGAGVASSRRLAGGDINDAFELELSSGERVFLKTNVNAAPAMFPAEAHGLEYLREAGALRIPEVIAVSDASAGAPAYLVLELLPRGQPVRDFDQRLGR